LRTQVQERAGGTGKGCGLAFIDHDRQRYADRVRLPHAGEFLVGDYLDDGGVGVLGELRIVLHELGDRRGRLDARLCVFGDGTGALSVLLDAAAGDLSGILAPVAGRAELSRRLTALGVRDASDTPLRPAGTQAG
jgi:hypothetical protein